MRTLYSKIAAVLFALFVLCGVVSIVATLHFFQLYSEESNQRLNQPLARHLADQNQLLSLQDANADRLRSMFDMQMIINPSIQIYLLDATGRIVSYSAAPGEVKLERVDLPPIRGPRASRRQAADPWRRSAPPGRSPHLFGGADPEWDQPQGYLYVMLAAERPSGLVGLLKQSDIVPTAAGVAALCVLFALLVGLCIFALMTRKLERLAGAMDEFQRRDFDSRSDILPAAARAAGDEIDRLTNTFREMAERITRQLGTLRQNDAAAPRAGRQRLARSEDADRHLARLCRHAAAERWRAVRRGAQTLFVDRFAQLRAARQAGGRSDRARQAGSA